MALVPLAPACVLAQPATSLERLTWTEVRDAIAAGKTTILVPVGGTEQNGPHMALGKHNARARELASRIAARLGDALVAPVLAYVPEGAIDPPTQHMKYPGTITAPVEAFERTLESAARGFRAHGFRDIALLGEHGGYQASLKRVAERLNRDWARAGSDARVHYIEAYYRAATVGFPQALRSRGFTDREIGEHAGLADTALTLDTDASLVRAERLSSAGKAPEGGVRGDPARASAELGRIGAALIVEESTQAITAARSRR